MKSQFFIYNAMIFMKQLHVLQFSAHEALHVVVNVGQMNMTK